MYLGHYSLSRFVIICFTVFLGASTLGPIGCGKNNPLRPATVEYVAPPDTAKIGNGEHSSDSALPSVILSILGQRGSFIAKSGSELSIEWSSKNTKSCQLYVNGQQYSTGGPTGFVSFSAYDNSTLKVVCQKLADAANIEDSAVITIASQASDPVITLYANGFENRAPIALNNSVHLTWVGPSYLTRCQITDGHSAKPVSISQLDGIFSEPLSSTRIFILVCDIPNSVAKALASVTTTVTDPPPATPTLTPTPTPTPSATPSPSPSPVAVVHTIFVSSRTYSGNLGGLSGADQKCQNLAVAANLTPATPTGTWKAILSDTSVNAKDRIVLSGDIFNVRGERVATATGANGLFSGSLLRAVRYTERNVLTEALNPPTLIGGVIVSNPGDPAGYEDIWSASNNQGVYVAKESSAANNACNHWTSSSGYRVAVGNSRRTDGLLDDPTGNDSSCDEQKYLLCISQ